MKNHLKRGLFKFQKVNRIIFLFLAMISVVASSCSKDDAPESPTLPIITVGSVTGTVKEGSNNLAGATIILKQAGQKDKGVTVGTDGVFSFSDVPLGSVSVVVSFSLYVTQTIDVTVTAGKTTNVAVVMGGDMTVKTLIPDAKFEEKLIKLGYDVAPIDGSVPTYKINRVKILSLNDSGVADLTGLQDFAALEYFYCSNLYGTSVIKITSIDISKNTALKEIDVSSNKIEKLDISKNTALVSLKLSYNLVTSLDVSKHTALTLLWIGNNPIASLDLSKNVLLKDLAVSSSNINTLDVSKNTALVNLYANACKFTNLDVSKNSALEVLWVGNNQLSTLDISKNPALRSLLSHYNLLTGLDVTNNPALIDINTEYNKITTLDTSKNTQLLRLSCGGNNLASLDLSNNIKLTSLRCNDNKLTTLDLSKNTLIATGSLNYLLCTNNLLTKLNLKNGNNINFVGGNFSSNAATLQIAVDDVNFSNTNWKNYKDATATYVNSFQ